jgi:dTDP-4-amino-4,6-dideoxygalactose transaminase
MDDEIDFTDIYVDDEIVERVSAVMRSTRWVKGPELEQFESEFASAVGADHAVGVSSGTAALVLGLDVLNVGPGDEVFVPGHTFFATASPVLSLGAKPVFVDIDPEHYTIDPEHLRDQVEAADNPTAVMPVHIYGQVADMDAVTAVAEEYDLAIVEDACQAHLATRNGQVAGSIGDIGCFSFYPSKNMAVGGDGGMLITDDDSLAESAQALRNHGRNEAGQHVSLGLNYRLDETNAAVGRVQLEHLPEWSQQRNSAAQRYSERLADVPEVVTPAEADNGFHVYHLYVIQTPDRNELREYLDEHGVQTGIHYETPAHRHEAITERVETPKLPVTEELVERIVSLPMHPRITDEEIDYVCDQIEAFYR